MDNKNHGPELLIGGLLIVIFLGMMVLKAPKELFIGLGQAFEAFGTMTASFAVMLFGILKVALLIALIIGVPTAAIYFTYRYVKLVKKATYVIEYVDAKTYATEVLVEQRIGDMNR